ncbi:glutamate-ammonia-ligase adenylyltransferase [Thalassotalea marina]|uniref:Bifunctional glutamine synthetase adenylyltransferase/adenylyl-removing enzyme n=1 Tax=Thalassotalea marina TaxID=1673741 RepID=A0A919BF27_9GAMM|nr:glutamate-ammonia-ligase adenylyltransferase [Thalassotalea marina]
MAELNRQVSKALLPELMTQKDKCWQQFCEQYPNLSQDFIRDASTVQLSDFQSALAMSDFIYRSALQAPEIVINLFLSGTIYDVEALDYKSLLASQTSNCDTEESLHRILRLFRLQHMVALAFADLLLDIPLQTSLQRLSSLADELILAALDWLSKFCYQKWGKPTNNLGKVQPLLVYGMGKLGGKELNFSSDIDLIFVYPDAGETQGGRRTLDNHTFFTRLAQKLISALHQKTEDGFVYRVDMRLRPFGDSGPLVLSFNAMEDYYQEQGRDWERYAMLKARLIGEGEYHKVLSSMLRPFVFRRYIDFSVIDSLRRMKMMISQEVRRKGLVNNIKLGAGGIREIEFIVQVFQLIRGGREKPLQERNLLTVLPLLVEHQTIDETTKNVLVNAYCFLRRLENIIQALDDQQTQTLPEKPLDQIRILQVLGCDQYSSWQALLSHLDDLMTSVHQEFILLIGEETPHHESEDISWAALWDSNWEQADGEEWIATEKPSWDASTIWQLLNNFKQEVSKKSVGARGRQVLDKLMPLVINHIAKLNADHICLERVLWILSKVVTRTAYIELLYENEGALKHLVKLCNASRWLAEHIAKYPIILDELIDPQLLNNPPALDAYKNELRQQLLRVPEDDLEAQMESLRQFKQAQQLRIAAADIVGVMPIAKVSDHLTALAEAITNEVVAIAWMQMVERYGRPKSLAPDDTGFAVIGYGKLGGIELSYSSDLDLVFVHQCDLNDVTDGVKEVSASQFYLKLAQRIMHIFNINMTSGILYELDMRLRPSGNSGVLVVSLDTFGQYQLNEAWTWEHQALVRARAIYGSAGIKGAFETIRQQVLSLPRNVSKLKNDVVEMRQKMRDHLDKSTEQSCDIKQGNGGMVDVEFLAQFMVLAHCHQYPQLSVYSDNRRIFSQLTTLNVISKQERDQLIESYSQLRDLAHKASLQNQDNSLPLEQFDQLAQPVVSVVKKYMFD